MSLHFRSKTADKNAATVAVTDETVAIQEDATQVVEDATVAVCDPTVAVTEDGVLEGTTGTAATVLIQEDATQVVEDETQVIHDMPVKTNAKRSVILAAETQEFSEDDDTPQNIDTDAATQMVDHGEATQMVDRETMAIDESTVDVTEMETVAVNENIQEESTQVVEDPNISVTDETVAVDELPEEEFTQVLVDPNMAVTDETVAVDEVPLDATEKTIAAEEEATQVVGDDDVAETEEFVVKETENDTKPSTDTADDYCVDTDEDTSAMNKTGQSASTEEDCERTHAYSDVTDDDKSPSKAKIEQTQVYEMETDDEPSPKKRSPVKIPGGRLEATQVYAHSPIRTPKKSSPVKSSRLEATQIYSESPKKTTGTPIETESYDPNVEKDTDAVKQTLVYDLEIPEEGEPSSKKPRGKKSSTTMTKTIDKKVTRKTKDLQESESKESQSGVRKSGRERRKSRKVLEEEETKNEDEIEGTSEVAAETKISNELEADHSESKTNKGKKARMLSPKGKNGRKATESSEAGSEHTNKKSLPVNTDEENTLLQTGHGTTSSTVTKSEIEDPGDISETTEHRGQIPSAEVEQDVKEAEKLKPRRGGRGHKATAPKSQDEESTKTTGIEEKPGMTEDSSSSHSRGRSKKNSRATRKSKFEVLFNNTNVLIHYTVKCFNSAGLNIRVIQNWSNSLGLKFSVRPFICTVR